MSTAAIVRRAERPARPSDRVFYSSLSFAMAATVFVGFASTYYGKLLTDAPLVTLNGAPFTVLIHVHGVLFTAWVVFFLAQTTLVAGRRVAVHRKMGIVGGLLALGMVITGTAVAIQTATRAAAAGTAVARR
jgi:hypothetical protein